MSQDAYQIDSLDRKILRYLQKDARKPFLEIARELSVSGGTIHQRVDRLRAAGVIHGSKVMLDPERLGYTVTALIGVHLNRAQDCSDVLRRLHKFPNVVEAHYTTGAYALMIKVMCTSMQDYHHFLFTKLQAIEAIRSTESFLCMATPIARDIEV